MIEDGDILHNKWVWLGGAAVLALVFYMSSSGGSGGGGYNSAQAINSMNQLAASEYNTSVSSQTQLGLASIQANAGIAGALTSMIGNMAQYNANVMASQAQVNAGVLNNIVTTGAAVSIDAMNNAARTQQLGITSDASVQLARINASAVKSSAQWNAVSSIAGKAIGSAASVISAMGG